MYHDNNWWYKQSIDVDFFFELLAKTLKLLDLTQSVNTIQEEKDSHTGKKVQELDKMLFFLVHTRYSCNKNGENARIGHKTLQNKTK